MRRARLSAVPALLTLGLAPGSSETNGVDDVGIICRGGKRDNGQGEPEGSEDGGGWGEGVPSLVSEVLCAVNGHDTYARVHLMAACFSLKLFSHA